MTKKTLLLRADDLASSHSANLAIAQVVKNGLVKNVSVMAVGPHLDEAADLLAQSDKLCFGMHATLNAEWDKVKWKPLTQLTKDSGLVDDQGYFLSDPRLFVTTKPRIEVILAEFEAQLTLLTQKGFKITYVDSHMVPEASVEGLSEALSEWIRQKGLINHIFYYGNSHFESITSVSDLSEILKNLEGGQHFMVVHPSLDTEEMRQTGNKDVPGNVVAASRQFETTVMSDPSLPKLLKDYDIETIRYDQAIPAERIDFEES
jgi:chitin disaccharide deacetylase